MVFFMEACFSGSMFQALSNNISIYVMTAANEHEESYATYCKYPGFPCLGDEFSVNWLEYLDDNDANKVSVKTLYQQTKNSTTDSHVSEYGDTKLTEDSVSDYIGGGKQSRMKRKKKKNGHNVINSVKSSEANIQYYYNRLISNSGQENRLQISNTIQGIFKDMKIVEEIRGALIKELATSDEEKERIVQGQEFVNDENGECFDNAVKHFFNKCFTKSQKELAQPHTQILINSCSAPWLTKTRITDVIFNVCSERIESNSVQLTDKEACWMGDRLCEILCYSRRESSTSELSGGCIDGVCKCSNA